MKWAVVVSATWRTEEWKSDDEWSDGRKCRIFHGQGRFASDLPDTPLRCDSITADWPVPSAQCPLQPLQKHGQDSAQFCSKSAQD